MLEIKNLTVTFTGGVQELAAVKGISFHLRQGEVLGIVGESGSGKSLTALAVMGLLPVDASATGEARILSTNISMADSTSWQNIRGRLVSMIFQEPMSSLNPVRKIGRQVCEVLETQGKIRGKEAEKAVFRIFEQLGVWPALTRFHQYPHQLSGGLKQRVLIAIALSCKAPLLIADEPTTALDVTVQAQILSLLQRNVRQQGVSLLLITHDLGVLAEMADRVLVMYSGRIVEEASVTELFTMPSHPYTGLLLSSVPRLDRPLPRIPAGFHPAPGDTLPGCEFAPRCPERLPECVERVPLPVAVSLSHMVCCHRRKGRSYGKTVAGSKKCGRPISPGTEIWG
jgi:oligopeptide/dipeptide ABC transporter ATP-binding protein